MRKTYAPNAIIIGIFTGLLVAIRVNTALGIIAGLAVSVLGWALIRAFEKATSHAVDSAADAIQKKFNERREEK